VTVCLEMDWEMILKADGLSGHVGRIFAPEVELIEELYGFPTQTLRKWKIQLNKDHHT
jgi:hypothetical protein